MNKGFAIGNYLGAAKSDPRESRKMLLGLLMSNGYDLGKIEEVKREDVVIMMMGAGVDKKHLLLALNEYMKRDLDALSKMDCFYTSRGRDPFLKFIAKTFGTIEVCEDDVIMAMLEDKNIMSMFPEEFSRLSSEVKKRLDDINEKYGDMILVY